MPSERRLQPINVRPKDIPFDQIVAVRGKNPIGEFLPEAGKAISNALVQREQLRRMAQQVGSIEKASGVEPGSFSGLSPDQALVMGKLKQQEDLKRQIAEANKKNYVIPQYDESGNVIGFSQVPQGATPYGGAKPNTYDGMGTLRAENRKDQGIVNVVKSFTGDASVKKAQQSLDSAGDIKNLAISGNPIAAASIPTFSARMAGEVGNLSEADKRPFGGSQALTARIQRSIYEMSTGQLSPDNKKFIIDLTGIIEKRAAEKIDGIARKRASQFNGTFGQSESEWYQRFTSEYLPNNAENIPKPQVVEAPVNPIALTGDKAARLQELRQKKALGLLR